MGISVNGVKISTNKSISGISGSRVNFSDGSWCDVSTGIVNNKGPGYIRLGDAQSDGKSCEKCTVEKSFPAAASLTVTNLMAKMNIAVHDGSGIEVKLTGPKSEVDQIKLGMSDASTLAIDGETGGSGSADGVRVSGFGNVGISLDESGISFGGVAVSGSGVRIGNMTVSGSGVSIGGPGTTIDVKVPKRTAVSARIKRGDLKIGDTQGDLSLVVSGQGDVRAGSVSNLTAVVQGQGDVRVREVNGKRTVIEVRGQGDVTVRGGQTALLEASIHGQGDIDFRGRATDSKLAVYGHGSIEVAHSDNRPTCTRRGFGDIEVGNW